MSAHLNHPSQIAAFFSPAEEIRRALILSSLYFKMLEVMGTKAMETEQLAASKGISSVSGTQFFELCRQMKNARRTAKNLLALSEEHIDYADQIFEAFIGSYAPKK